MVKLFLLVLELYALFSHVRTDGKKDPSHRRSSAPYNEKLTEVSSGHAVGPRFDVLHGDALAELEQQVIAELFPAHEQARRHNTAYPKDLE